MRKYSSIFWWLILFGVVSVIFTISSIVEHLPVPTAIGSICTFIFFWVSLMLDDADKYKRDDICRAPAGALQISRGILG